MKIRTINIIIDIFMNYFNNIIKAADKNVLQNRAFKNGNQKSMGYWVLLAPQISISFRLQIFYLLNNWLQSLLVVNLVKFHWTSFFEWHFFCLKQFVLNLYYSYGLKAFLPCCTISNSIMPVSWHSCWNCKLLKYCFKDSTAASMICCFICPDFFLYWVSSFDLKNTQSCSGLPNCVICPQY